jgi:iron complex transport system substrate-binding protein
MLPEMRIVSLTPATTEILFELGLDKEIVGVSSYCTWPDKAVDKEKVGSFSNPNIEKIIMLKPDLVILTGMEQEYIKDILSRLKIKYINVDPANLGELIFSIEKLGNATGTNPKAKMLADSIRSVISRLKRFNCNIPRSVKPKIYMEIWHDPIMCPGKNSFVDDMIETAGGINITADLNRSYSRIDPEQVILRDPDIIILTYMKQDDWVGKTFVKRLGWEDVSAIKKRRIYADINPDIILRPGPRVVKGLLELHKRFYED